MLKKVLAVSFILSACSAHVASEQGWEIKLVSSGGIAGVYQETIVRQNGLVTIKTKGNDQTILSKLTLKEKAQLSQAIEDIDKHAQPVKHLGGLPGNRGCRDCMATTLEIHKENTKIIKYRLDYKKQDSDKFEEILYLLSEITKRANNNTDRENKTN